MAAIADLEDYVSGMRKSMDDKLWFLDFIGTDVTSVYDYGCADGTLLRRVQDERPDVCLYGYDNNGEMLKIARNRLQNSAVSSRRMETARPGQVTVVSSVFHEIHSYGTNDSILSDYRHIFEIGSDYIAIRDMFYSFCMPENASAKVVQVVRMASDKERLREFENVYGSIDRNKNLTHWLLKYRYVENWRRELAENYLPNSFEEFLNATPKEYDCVYAEMYTLPFLHDRILSDYGVDWKYPTHGKILLKKRG